MSCHFRPITLPLWFTLSHNFTLWDFFFWKIDRKVFSGFIHCSISVHLFCNYLQDIKIIKWHNNFFPGINPWSIEQFWLKLNSGCISHYTLPSLFGLYTSYVYEEIWNVSTFCFIKNKKLAVLKFIFKLLLLN